MYRPSSTVRLLSRARDGSRSGLGDLLESYRPLLKQMAQAGIGSRLRRRMSESDLVQETMLAASRGFSRFQGQSEREFRGWLVSVLRSRMIDGLRRHMIAEKRRADPASLADLADELVCLDSPWETVSIAEETERLIDALVSLDATDREIILARYFQQLNFETIAGQLELPLSTVWRRWNRAMEQLHRRLTSPVA